MKLVGERRALSAVIFAFYALLYFVLGMSNGSEFTRALYALAGVYGLAFFALVAGYFWARWYAVGVALYGVLTGAVGLWQVGPEPVIVFLAATHVAAALMLWGDAMSASYDGQTAWRERYHMDEPAVNRLGRSVIRAGVSLPMVLLYALAPKSAGSALAISVAVLALLGFRGLVRMKTWGVLALGAAGATLLAAAAVQHGPATVMPAITGGLVAWAVLPFARPMLRFVARG